MILRNARNEVEDLGPRRTFSPSLMKPIIGYTDTPGGWTGSAHHKIFAARTPHATTRTHPVMPTHTFDCAECGEAATRYTAAIYCGDRCRNRAAKRAQRQRQRMQTPQDRVVHLHPLETTR